MSAAIKQRILTVLIALVIALYYITDFRYLHEGVFYLLLAAAVLLPPRDGNYWRGLVRPLRKQPLLWVIMAYVLYQWCSLGWSTQFAGSELAEVVRKSKFSLLWMWLAASALKDEREASLLWPVMVIAAAVSAGMSLPDGAAYSADGRLIGYGRSENAVQAASLYGIAALVAWYLFCTSCVGGTAPNPPRSAPPLGRRCSTLQPIRVDCTTQSHQDFCFRFIMGGCAILLTFALNVTASRGALLGLSAGLAFILLPYYRRYAWGIMVVILAGLVSIDWPALWMRADGFRLEIWREVIHRWQESPLLGLGFRTPFTLSLSNGQEIFQPHSLYLTALYYGGIIGLSLLLAVWITAFYQAWRGRQSELLPLGMLVYSFVIALFDFDLLLVNVRQEWILFWLPWAATLALTARKYVSHTAPDNPHQKLRILHSLFSNGIGGTERHLAELASAQAQEGHEVYVMLRADRNPYEGRDALCDWLDTRVQVLRAPRRWPLLPLWWQVWRLRPDIIHTHHRRDSRYLGMVAPPGVPVIATLHLPYRAGDYCGHQGLICVAPWQEKTLTLHPIQQSIVIPNWISASASRESQRAILRAELGASADIRILGYVGRLTEEKGVLELVEAFLAIPQEVASQVQLHLFGEGECRPAIEATITQAGAGHRIILHGYDPDIRRWYAALDGLVLPSREETFGLVLLEAMVAGLPILSTRNHGALDLLGKTPWVEWAECSDTTDLHAALIRFLPLLGEKYIYPELEKYTPGAAFGATMAFYRDMLRRFSSSKSP